MSNRFQSIQCYSLFSILIRSPFHLIFFIFFPRIILQFFNKLYLKIWNFCLSVPQTKHIFGLPFFHSFLISDLSLSFLIAEHGPFPAKRNFLGFINNPACVCEEEVSGAIHVLCDCKLLSHKSIIGPSNFVKLQILIIILNGFHATKSRA